MKIISIMLIFLLCQRSQSKSYTLGELYKNGLDKNPEGRILESQAKEIYYGIKAMNGEYFPEVYAVVGGERRQSSRDSTINTNRFVAEMRLKYNLFKFGQSKNSIKALEELHKVKLHKYSLWKQDIIRETKSLYYDALTINKKLNYLKKELLYNRKMKLRTKKRISKGLTGKSDILDIDLRKLSMEVQILELSEQLDHKLDEVRKVSFIDHKDGVELNASLPHTHYNLDLKSLLKKSRLNNRNINLSELEEKVTEYEQSKVSSNRLPEVNLMGRFGRMRIDEQYSTGTTEGLVGVYVNIPLFDGGKKKSTQEIYKEKYKQRKLKLDSVKNDVSIEVTHKYELLDNIHRQLDLVEMSHKRGAKYYTIVLDEYNRGIKNSLDLVSARDRLVNLKLKMFESQKNYLITALTLEKLIGEQL